jgi:hypothetical protein
MPSISLSSTAKPIGFASNGTTTCQIHPTSEDRVVAVVKLMNDNTDHTLICSVVGRLVFATQKKRRDWMGRRANPDRIRQSLCSRINNDTDNVMCDVCWHGMAWHGTARKGNDGRSRSTTTTPQSQTADEVLDSRNEKQILETRPRFTPLSVMRNRIRLQWTQVVGKEACKQATIHRNGERIP